MRLACVLIFGACAVTLIRGNQEPYDEYVDDMEATGARQGARDGGQRITMRWTKCVTSVNVCVVTCRNIIGRIEEALAKFTSTFIKIVTFIPVAIAKLAFSLAEGALKIIVNAKFALEGFFKSIYGSQARVLYGTVMELQEVVTRIFTWGQTCIQTRGSQCTQLPHVGGYGPCGGVWPCRTTVVCYKPVCLPGRYGGRESQYGGAQGHFDGTQGQFGGTQGQFDGTQGQYGGTQGQFDGTQGQFVGAQGEFGGTQGQFGGLQRRFGSRHSDRQQELYEQQPQLQLQEQ